MDRELDRVITRSCSVQPSRRNGRGLFPIASPVVAALVAVLGLTSGCSARQDDLDYEGTPGRDVGGADCTAGQKRCAGKSLQSCERGTFRTSRECLSDQICEVNLGCVQCNPVAPTACSGDTVRRCNGDGTFGEVVETCKPGACAAGKCGEICTAAGSDLIYVVDNANRLFSFNPRDNKYEFKLIGEMNCPAGRAPEGGRATPFSMSVDRDGRAWVLYSSGEIFHVETKDASCKATGFSPLQSGFEVFGMGFVSESEGSNKETLFIGGGDYDDLTRASLGTIDSTSLLVNKIAALSLQGQRSPELTGTGKGELYGYFPGPRPFVAQLEKTTGRSLRSWSLPALSGEPRAWAFAHWGGRYFIFISVDGSNSILMLDPATGMAQKIKDSPYKIVGAGVSTCAPVIIG